MIFRHFYIVCRQCGYRNRPHNSPREGVRLALLDQLPPCRGCGREIKKVRLSDRPMVLRVRAELQAQGITTVC